MDNPSKATVSLEARARRVAARHGFLATKSRKRSLSADNGGGFMLVDASTNRVEADERYDLSAEQVIAFFDKGGRMTDATILFRDALQSAYGPLDWLPLDDGDIHRFHVPGDKSGTLNGWYCLFADGIASGAFGSWKTGGTSTWCSREPVDAREAEQVRQRIEQARRQREAERQRRQLKAAGLAQRWWRDARRADPTHPYLVAKGIRAHGLRQRGEDLLIPLYAGGVLVNLQRIAPDGAKRFLYGGRIKGAYSPLGRITPGRPLCICEGWATGATLHESGYTVACAMNAGNLKAVALALRADHPGTEIIIAGDDDRETEAEGKGNPGRTAAHDAAAACGGLVTFPEWPVDAPLTLSDFNDLAVWRCRHATA